MKYVSLLLFFCVSNAQAAYSLDAYYNAMYDTLHNAKSDKEGCAIIQEYIKRQHDINRTFSSTNSDNGTLLHCAAYKGYVESMRLLLTHNANPNIPNKNGWAPLMNAVHDGHDKLPESSVNAVTLLLEHGADVHLEPGSLWGNKVVRSESALLWLLKRKAHNRWSGNKAKDHNLNQCVQLFLDSTTYDCCTEDEKKYKEMKSFFDARDARDAFLRENFLIPELAQIVIDYQRLVIVHKKWNV